MNLSISVFGHFEFFTEGGEISRTRWKAQCVWASAGGFVSPLATRVNSECTSQHKENQRRQSRAATAGNGQVLSGDFTFMMWIKG